MQPSRSACERERSRRRSSRVSRSPSFCRPSRGLRSSSRSSPSSGAEGWPTSRGLRRLSADEPGAAAALEQRLAASGLVATKADDPELARYLEGERRIVRLGDGYVVSAGAYEVAQDLVRTECAAAGEITIARFRDLGGVGRRDAQLLLERMDVDGITRRIGDRRVLRRAARAL